MNSEYRQSNKKGKGLSPILKFALILILLFVVGFFVFYIIDNPDFLKEKIASVRGGDEGDERISAGSEDSRIQSVVTENEESLADINRVENGAESETESIGESEAAYTLENETENTVLDESASGEGVSDTIIDSGENDNESNDENEDSNNAGGSTSLWQKIINFITRRGDNGKEEDTYPSRLEINFYFSGLGEEKKLVSEKRTINAGSPDIAVQNAITELLKGPLKPHYFPVIPAGTELLGAEVSENIAKIDFSQEFLENSLDTRILDEYIIYSIVNTLTEIPEIEGVVFYIEGVRIRMYGNVDLSIPSIRNNDFIEEE